jgi:hypothetical protein
MIEYRQFQEALEISLKHNLKLSHINNMVSKGFTKAELLVNPNLIDFRFWGHHLHTQHFKPRESFFTESKLLHSQEPLGYALLNSCIDAENSTIDLGIPQTYKVILEVSGESSYRCTVNVPKGVREKTTLSVNPNGNYSKFKSFLEEYLSEKVRRAHINSVVEDGFRSVRLQIYSDGKIGITFGGEHSYTSKFSSLEDFYKRSDSLGNREGFCYALVDSCVSAEKSAIGDIPKAYKVVCKISENGDFSYNIE